MRRVFILCFALLMVFSAACAEMVGVTPEDGRIFAYLADNGQTLYFTGTAFDEPLIQKQDVNFDGVEDLLICTHHGASNGFFQVFVRTEDGYVNPGVELVNAQFFPEDQLVMTFSQNGWAGALHEQALYRWEGTKLVLLRSATGVEKTEATFTEDGWTLFTSNRELTLKVQDHADPAAPQVLFQAEVLLENAESALRAEEAAFWEGLR